MVSSSRDTLCSYAVEIIYLVPRSAKLPDADDFIVNMTRGYATTIGAQGSELIGGQKQRIALARRLNKDLLILSLDEATSALDFASEQNIRNSSHGFSIGFESVNASYTDRPDTQTPYRLEFEIQAGQFYALVGPTGAGKSTIISLLKKFYRLTSSTIELSDRNISHQESSFRGDIPLVPQDNALFDDIMRSNIALSARPNQEIAYQEVQAACLAAKIH